MTTTHNTRVDEAELERLGIVRVPTDVFLWSDYRYSKAGDAIAARRGTRR